MTTDTTLTYELTLHFTRPRYIDMIRIHSAEDVNRFLRDRIETELINHKEFFWIVITTRANGVLGLREISSGNGNATMVSLKEVAQTCILANASACVMVHNHPSGNLKPSQSDLKITQRAEEALDLFEIILLDHLIITQEGYYSFSDNGLLIRP